MTRPTGGDITATRLFGIAEGVCTNCRGVPHAPHEPAGYAITGMQGYAKLRPDCAVAWFGLTRGSVVVRIDGQSFWMWWMPTLDAGEAHYRDVRKYMVAQETQQVYDPGRQ